MGVHLVGSGAGNAHLSANGNGGEGGGDLVSAEEVAMVGVRGLLGGGERAAASDSGGGAPADGRASEARSVLTGAGRGWVAIASGFGAGVGFGRDDVGDTLFLFASGASAASFGSTASWVSSPEVSHPCFLVAGKEAEAAIEFRMAVVSNFGRLFSFATRLWVSGDEFSAITALLVAVVVASQATLPDTASLAA